MGYKIRLKIGEFSRLMQVTIKTLRHYEQKELLIPDEVDEWTGYKVAGQPRTCYIDGIWNQEDPEKWLSIIQIPIE